MKKKVWLILDCHYLCYRALHTTGQLSHEDVLTGVIYGFLRDVMLLQEQFLTNRLVFCFDRSPSHRARDYPGYKANRTEDGMDKEEKLARAELRRQIKLLRSRYLRQVGFRNIFHQQGYEADDVIASVVRDLPKTDEAIIVSADRDLIQLLKPNVFIWNPHKKKAYTLKSLYAEFGIEPMAWVDIKALAGCGSDNVEGIRGVGEKTAAKFLRGHLKAESAAFQAIVKGDKIWRRNRALVKLPYPGVERFCLIDDEVDDARRDALMIKLGMKSLVRSGKKSNIKRKGFGL